MRVRTVIFDLDGTLVDTSGDLIAAANRAFAHMGHDVVLDPETDAGTALRGGRAMLRLGLERLGQSDEAEVDRGYPVLLDAYENDLSRRSYLYPGAMQAVSALQSAGFAVGICTNKPERMAHQLFVDLGIRDAFASLVGADTLPVCKPDPKPLAEAVRRAGGDPARCLLVGDTETDRKTSAALGVPSVLVTFSPAGQSVAALQPDALLHDFADLPRLADQLLP